MSVSPPPLVSDDDHPTAPATPPGFDPGAEQAHWREQHALLAPPQPAEADPGFEAYLPAYELGWRRRLSSEQPFDEHEGDLAREWQQHHGASPLGWPAARAASRAAWERTDRRCYEQARQTGLAEAFAFIEAADGSLGPVPRSEAFDHELITGLLNHLLENAHDGEHGFRECAQRTGEPELKTFFDTCADQYRDMAETLRALVLHRGGQPHDGGTLLAAVQRGWTQLRAALGADDTGPALLAQCERAEQRSIDRYRSALQHRLPDALREPLERQSAAARQRCELIRELLDALHPAASDD